jgi:iron-sulfur cluster repair protein YtfE (RIC family)
MKPPAAVMPSPAVATDSAPWRSDLASLERQLKSEMRTVQTAAVTAQQAQPVRASSSPDAEVVRRVRALIEESEKRQQNELALRVAEVLRDVHAQRQADLIKIDRTLGAVENRVGVEVMKDRQRLNTLLVRTSGRQ